MPRSKRESSPPTAYVARDDTPRALAVARGRRIILSTGRGDTRLHPAEARALARALEAAAAEAEGGPPCAG